MNEKQSQRHPHRAWLACLIIILLLAGAGAGAYGLYRTTINAAEDYYRSRYLAFDLSNEDYDYSETTAKLLDPGGSFYNLITYLLSDDTKDDELIDRLRSETELYADEELVLIELNLMNYNDRALSDTALAQTDRILQIWSDAGYGIVLRFLYDWDGRSAETEPKDLSLIQTHMSQVAPIVNTHAADIFTMQGIFVGDFAEMHGGSHMDSDSMCALALHLDSVIDPDIFLSVRTPAHRRMILGTAEVFPEGSTLAKRLGLFNDGMLGSGNDLGTYGDTDRTQSVSLEDHWLRDQELEYQDELCRFVPNGGEAVIDNPLNDLEQAIDTLATMHVSYLNRMHHAEVIDKWRAGTVHTEDVWNGTNGYDYIDAHLGCRYRCTGTTASSFDFWSEDATELELTFTNTGFSDFCEPLTLTASIVADNGSSPAIKNELQEDTLATITNGETCTVSLPLDLRSCEDGTYRVYVSCTRIKSGKTVEFASGLPLTEYGYEVASFSVDRTPTTIPPTEDLLERYISHWRASRNSLAK